MNDIADHDIVMEKGPLSAMTFPVTMDPYLRKLGLNTKIDRGVIILLEDKPIAVAGEPISAEQGRLLKLLGHKLVSFKYAPTSFGLGGLS